MKILIADDDIVSLRLLEKTLERAGYEVISVENGRAAAEHLCQPDGPRLALLDWVMPEMDGPSVCRKLRQPRDHAYIYTILLTSKESKQDVITGLESGADDYLIKPWNPEELKARLRTGQRILHLEDRLVEAREDMRYKATHDPLTSLLNRAVIMDLLSRELTRTEREQGCTAVLLGDLDHFKRINDSHGHIVGDQVLREVAKRMLESVRSYDFVARYGGEEFLVVLNNCDAGNAVLRADEIRKAIARRPVETSRGPLDVTMSLGVLAVKHRGPVPVEDLLREVDEALYQAKSAGRNCTRLAQQKCMA